MKSLRSASSEDDGFVLVFGFAEEALQSLEFIVSFAIKLVEFLIELSILRRSTVTADHRKSVLRRKRKKSIEIISNKVKMKKTKLTYKIKNFCVKNVSNMLRTPVENAMLQFCM